MSFVDDIAQGLQAIEATAEQLVARAAALGNHGSAGPDNAPQPTAITLPTVPHWDVGWWAGAKRSHAHAGRCGGIIRPWATVVHTTDMLPGDWDALVASWTGRPGDGACAHFLIGRDESHGVLQLMPVFRNGNHAGGPVHGVFDTDVAKGLHPNLVAVGIELHCAGGVRQVGGAWRFVEGGVAHGAALPTEDVIADPAHPGRGWHVITDYQRVQLAALLTDLETVLAPLPAGAKARSTGETPDAFTVMPTARVVTHAQLDPAHRADPWKPTCDWLRSRG